MVIKLDETGTFLEGSLAWRKIVVTRMQTCSLFVVADLVLALVRAPGL